MTGEFHGTAVRCPGCSIEVLPSRWAGDRCVRCRNKEIELRERWWELRPRIDASVKSDPAKVPEMVEEANDIFREADLSFGNPPICLTEWDGERLSYGPDYSPS